MQFSSKQLKQLWSYDSEMSPAVERAVKDFIDTYPPNARDQKLAYEMSSQKRAGALLNPAAVEESAWSLGGRVLYTEDEVVIVRPAGDTMEHHNTVIPNMTNERVRPGLYQLIAILGTFFRYNGSTRRIEMVSTLPIIEESWGVSASVLRPAALIPLMEMFREFITNHVMWTSMQETQRSSLTGSRWLVWLSTVFEGCPYDDYLAFHSTVAYDFLKTFRKVGGVKNATHVPIKVMRPDGEEVPMIAPGSLMVLNAEMRKKLPPKAREAAESVAKVIHKDPVVLKGPFPTAHQFVDSRLPTFEKAYKAAGKGATLRGGDGSGLNILSGAIGFSGLPTKLARHQQLLTATAAFLMQHVASLDIYCQSIGVIPLLHSSLLAARTLMPSSCTWKYITSFADSANVEKTYTDFVQTSFRMGSHRMWVTDQVMPSAKKVADVLLESAVHMNKFLADGVQFTYYGPLYGAAPWLKGRYVFKFANPSSFKGFCSTRDDLSLVGFKHEGHEVASPVVTPLERVISDTQWYGEVIRANVVRNSYFLRPGRQYSPISNTVVPPTKGVKFAIKGADFVHTEQGDADEFLDEDDEDEEEIVTYVPDDGSGDDDEDNFVDPDLHETRGDGEEDDESEEEEKPQKAPSSFQQGKKFVKPKVSFKTETTEMAGPRPSTADPHKAPDVPLSPIIRRIATPLTYHEQYTKLNADGSDVKPVVVASPELPPGDIPLSRGPSEEVTEKPGLKDSEREKEKEDRPRKVRRAKEPEKIAVAAVVDPDYGVTDVDAAMFQ